MPLFSRPLRGAAGKTQMLVLSQDSGHLPGHEVPGCHRKTGESFRTEASDTEVRRQVADQGEAWGRRWKAAAERSMCFLELLAPMPSEHCRQTGCHIFQHLQMTKMLTHGTCLVGAGVRGWGWHVRACLHPVLMPPDSGPWVPSGHSGTQTKCGMPNVWSPKCMSFTGVNRYFYSSHLPFGLCLKGKLLRLWRWFQDVACAFTSTSEKAVGMG